MSHAHAVVAKDPRVDPVRSARRAGLHHIDDRSPGIRRRKVRGGFMYLDASGKVVRDKATLSRIRALVIPPAWTDVWICPSAQGHIQATGRDAKGRKQYRYHTRFRQVREETKYEKIFDFAAALPKIRARANRDIKQPNLTREKVLAAVVLLLEETLIRVGNEEYSRLNKSFGLTTLRDRHARIHGSSVEFRFRGKSGKDHSVAINDRRLARVVKRCRDLPGDELFQYLDRDGTQHSIGSHDVNDYLRSITGEDFTAKDFRTWAGTVLAAIALQECGAAQKQSEIKKQLVSAVQKTAERLGNTPAVCRKCYVHPAILDAYTRGEVMPRFRVANGRDAVAALRADEKAVLAFLRRTVAKQGAQNAAQNAPGSLGRNLKKSLAKARSLRELPTARQKRA